MDLVVCNVGVRVGIMFVEKFDDVMNNNNDKTKQKKICFFFWLHHFSFFGYVCTRATSTLRAPHADALAENL